MLVKIDNPETLAKNEQARPSTRAAISGPCCVARLEVGSKRSVLHSTRTDVSASRESRLRRSRLRSETRGRSARFHASDVRSLADGKRGKLAFVQVMADQRKQSAVAFLEAAVAYFAKLGVRIERVMTDNGPCYQSKVFWAACKHLGLRQIKDQRKSRTLHTNSTP